MLRAGRSRVRFPMRSLDFSIDLILPSRTMALGSTQPLTEMSIPGIFLGVKGGRSVGQTTSPQSVSRLSRSIVLNIFCSRTPRCNFSSTLYPQNCWCIIQERERNGAPKSDVRTSEFPEANPKSGPDYSVFSMK
jgi:hypothetical protein